MIDWLNIKRINRSPCLISQYLQGENQLTEHV